MVAGFEARMPREQKETKREKKTNRKNEPAKKEGGCKERERERELEINYYEKEKVMQKIKGERE